MWSWLQYGIWSVILLATRLPAVAADPGCPARQAAEVRIGQQTWRVDVAWDEAQRRRGLSGRARMAPGHGMWFVLPGPGLHGFWMRDMTFSIDLIWVTPDRRVAGSLYLSPCGPGPCLVYRPDRPVAYVLEVNAGEFGGRPGDTVSWRCRP